MHGEVSREMWSSFQDDICEIKSITNAQNKSIGTDDIRRVAFESDDDPNFCVKRVPYSVVADQSGTI